MRLLRKFLNLLKLTAAFEFGHRHATYVLTHKKLHHLVATVMVTSTVVIAIGFGCAKIAGMKSSATIGAATINKLSVGGNTITVEGSGLTAINKLKIKDGNKNTELKIVNQSSSKMTLQASSALSLVLGATYSLLVSTASASDVLVPITVQVADGSINLSSLAGGNASSGQVLSWNGNTWAPATPASGGGSGGSSAGSSGVWLTSSDGTPIAPLIRHEAASGFQVWDSTNSAFVWYIYNTGTNQIKMTSVRNLIYLTSDCSGTPYAEVNTLNQQNIPGGEYYTGGKFYKVEPIGQVTAPIRVRGELNDGTLGACTSSAYPSQFYYKVSEITPPSLPSTIANGSFKFAWMGSGTDVRAPASTSGKFWLANTDGSLIGELLSWQGGPNIQVWDEADGLMVNYSTFNGGLGLVSSGGFYPYYTTTNCTGQAYGSAQAPNTLGSVPNTAIGSAGKFYKIETVRDTVTIRSQTGEDAAGNSMGCTVLNTPLNGPFLRITEIANPGVPMRIPFGTYKFIKQ
jgi:hypothetical protein